MLEVSANAVRDVVKILPYGKKDQAAT